MRTTMQPTSLAFKSNVKKALGDEALQKALAMAEGGFQKKRADAADKLPEFDALRDAAKAIKDHTLGHLDLYLEAFEQRVIEQGGQVHWAEDDAQARSIITKLCKEAGALQNNCLLLVQLSLSTFSPNLDIFE